jgi:hypothetical protein
MTPEQQLVHTAVEELLRLANRHKVVICGFAFAGDPEPMVVNFGNCTDAHKLELYESLVKLCDDKRATGQVSHYTVGEVH